MRLEILHLAAPCRLVPVTFTLAGTGETVADPQRIWSEYYSRKRAERVYEAGALWEAMKAAGVTHETVLALDFVCFGPCESDVRALGSQLSENYEVQITSAAEPGYFTVLGTTRPLGISLEKEQHTAWVEFMADVAQSYRCVFSEWTLEAPALGRTFRSAEVDDSAS